MELEFIDWLRTRLGPSRAGLIVGPGDDAAVVDLHGANRCVVTTDVLTEGVDFVLSECDPRRIGRKALAVNLSDLAAMAAVPRTVVVGLVLPRQGAFELARELYEGLLPLAEQFETTVAGGDTNTWDGPLVVGVTAIGTLTERGPFLRSGARPGDAIAVTGTFGGSLRGKHFDFTPRVREALHLREHYDVRAAMDVSDGLSLDLSRMCAACGCGAELDAAAIPIADEARAAAAADPGGLSPLERALGDGEDFELLVALPVDEAERLSAAQLPGVGVTTVGRFVAEPGLWLNTDAGRRPIAPRGYRH